MAYACTVVRGDDPSGGDRGPTSIWVAGTAYNWLSVYRTSSFESVEVSPLGRSVLARLDFSLSEKADAAYAILNSRLLYWLWRVECDGFHVTRAFLERVPFDWGSFDERTRIELGELGLTLWTRVVNHPVVSINGGKKTVSFCPNGCTEELDAIDEILLHAAGLPPALGRGLREFVLATAVVDFKDENRNARSGRPLAAWASR